MLENPITDITIALELNYFQLNSAEYFIPVAVKMPGSELVLAQRRGAKRMTLDVIVEVKDDYGITQQNMRDKLDMYAHRQVGRAARLTADSIRDRLHPPAGEYVIKFLVRDAESGASERIRRTSHSRTSIARRRSLPISTVVLGSQRVPLGSELFSVKTAQTQKSATR